MAAPEKSDMFLAKVMLSLLRVADFKVAELSVPEFYKVGALLRVLAKNALSNALLIALVRSVAAFSNPLEAMWVDFFLSLLVKPKVGDRAGSGEPMLILLAMLLTKSALLMTCERILGINEGT